MQAGTADSTTFGDASGKLTRGAWAALLVLCGALFSTHRRLDDRRRPAVDPSPTSTVDQLAAVGRQRYVLGYGGFLLLAGAPPTCSGDGGCS